MTRAADPFEALRAVLQGRTPRRVADPSAAGAAVAVLLVRAGSGLDLLIIRRADRPGDPWSGHMALPGGRRESTDTSLLVTAMRETLEETGIGLAAADCLGSVDDVHPSIPGVSPLVIRPFVFGLAQRPAVRPNREVALHLWVPLDSLAAARTRTTVRVRDADREVEAFILGPHVIWGITHRIIRPLVDLVNNET